MFRHLVNELINYAITTWFCEYANGRHFENSKIRYISAAVSAISTKFGTVTQFDDPLDPSNRYKFEFKKMQDGDASAIFKKIVKWPYLDRGSSDFDKMHDDAVGHF